MAKQTKLSNGTRLYDKDIVILQRGYDALSDAKTARYWNDEFKAMERLGEAGLTRRTNVVYFELTDAGIATLRELGLIVADAAPQAGESASVEAQPAPAGEDTFYSSPTAETYLADNVFREKLAESRLNAVKYIYRTSGFSLKASKELLGEIETAIALKESPLAQAQARIAQLEADNKRLQALFDACTSEANDTSVEHVMALEQQIEALEDDKRALVEALELIAKVQIRPHSKEGGMFAYAYAYRTMLQRAQHALRVSKGEQS